MNIVLIPAYNRAELLSVCIRRIQQAHNWCENYYFIALDTGFDKEVFQVADAFLNLIPKQAEILFNKRCGAGNNSNILQSMDYAYRRAKSSTYPFTYRPKILNVIEDDTLVAKDYFDWHSQAHREYPEVFAASACLNQFDKRKSEDPSSVFLHHRVQGIGVSFKLNSLPYILVHNTPLYFENESSYVQAAFPFSKYRGDIPSWDGLCDRLIFRYDKKVLYPYAPRATHCGYWGLHRVGERPKGTLEERIEQLESMSAKDMNTRTSRKDIDELNFEGYPPQSRLTLR
jgi:hypothetical protein